MRRTIERRLAVAFSLALGFLIVNAIISYRAVRTVIRNEQSVTRALLVLNELEATLSIMKDAETGERGYIITGDETFLEPYQAALDEINSHVKELKQLTADNPYKQTRIPALEREIADRLNNLKRQIALRRSGDAAGVKQVMLSGVGKSRMDEIRRLIAEMEDEENALLKSRAGESEASARTATLTSAIASLIAVASFALLYYLAIRGLAERRRGEEERGRLLAREQAARADAEAANRAKDEFLATVSHELRTPLNAILGWSRLLRIGRLDAQAAGKAIETIEQNAKAQAQLIEDLLDVSRIISGKLRINYEQVNMVTAIEAALETARPAAQAKSIQLRAELDSTAGAVAGDATRLQQVIWNLLSNAIKFTPKDGRVEIRLERADSQAQITVSDTGRGISPEFLPHVFERFRQADAKDTRQHGGLGLGLAIVRRLVEMHGGTVKADSPGEGKGATFTVGLPLRAVQTETGKIIEEKAAESRARLGRLPALDGVKVLAVDDEPGAREIITAVLTQCGATVTAVASAADAITVLAQSQPDVLVSDIGMPDENGYELISKVRRLKPEQGGNIPAVALTAYARTDDRLRALAAGFQAHIPKPVEPAELAMVVAGVIKSAKAGEQSKAETR